MKRIVARVRGGLGNQMFIVSQAFFYKIHSREDARVYLDIREYGTYKLRSFEMDRFKAADSFRYYDPGKDSGARKYELLMKLFHLRQFLCREMNLPERGPARTERRLNFIFDAASDSLDDFSGKTIYMYGYFGNARQLLTIRDELRRLFEIREPIADDPYAEQIREAGHTIAVSARLGEDYVRNKWPICSADYYKRALRALEREDSIIFVFTDEIEKARAMFKGEHYVFIENRSPAEQLSLMKSCDDFVISNSTFSWWGAFLGHKEDRKIYCPEKWHERKTRDYNIFYEQMTIIPN